MLPAGTEELPAAAGELPTGGWVLPGMVVPAPVVDGPGFAVVAVSLALRIRSLSAFTKSSSVFMVTVCDSFIALKRIAGTDNHTFIADEPHGTIGELTEDIV